MTPSLRGLGGGRLGGMIPLRDEPACVRQQRLVAALFFLAAVATAIAAFESGRDALWVSAGCHVVAWSCFVVAANRTAAGERVDAGSR